MTERRAIVELWKRDASGILVTLVRAEGSSYRRPGARLLTTAAGGYAGTISGGCLESEVVRKAAWLAREHAVVERYAMGFDDSSDIPFGLGCGGTVDLLFEPLGTPEADALLAAMQDSLAGKSARVIHFLPDHSAPERTRDLRRLILREGGEIVFASTALSTEKIDCARGLQAGEAYDGRFVETLEVPQRLYVFGAGDDAKPLVETAAMLGWTVTVADGRAQLAKAERFPRAAQVLAAGESFWRDEAIGEQDAVVLMTHSFEQDRGLLVRILPLAPRYLGLLGSRHRSSVLVSEAAAMLGQSVASCCERVHAPVGMDLGGDGPEAIALAIVAEMQAVCHARMPRSRRLSAEDVAQHIEQGGASRYLQAQCALGGE